MTNTVPIVIIKNHFEHHVLANQHVNEITNTRQKYYKVYDEALKNTANDDNSQFQVGCKHANKFVQLNQEKWILNQIVQLWDNIMKELHDAPQYYDC